MNEEILNMNDTKLRKLIMDKLKENDIDELYSMTAEEMADWFLEYTPLGRKYILEYYSQLEPTKSKMNWVAKIDFEHKYFYIGGTDAIVSLALLGFKVDKNRHANISLLSQRKLEKQDEDIAGQSWINNGFFERNNLKSEDINRGWNNDAN